MTTVRYTETYDLSTQVDKMGLIAVHTPTMEQLAQFYPGLLMNHRFIRVESCDIVCACASVLPADPLQVGTEAGDIAPQDMFNPILFKAVSNDSFNTLLNRLYGLAYDHVGPQNGSLDGTDDAFTDASLDDFQLYYSILGSQDGWRKAMPQQGFEMSGLYPIVYHLLNTNGSPPPTTSGLASLTQVNADGSTGSMSASSPAVPVTFRGNACRMPRVPIHNGYPSVSFGNISVTSGETTTDRPTLYMDSSWGRMIPRTYVGAIITPPAKLHKLYYRMRVTWTFTFEEVIPITEYIKPSDIARRGQYLYGSDYAEQSSKMDNTESSVDTKDVDLERIMTAGK